jgi:hypothetical protein
MLRTLLNDEAGFIVSAELVLVATILVIGMIVGLSEIQHAVVAELGDVAEAIGSVNQSYTYSGFAALKNGSGGSAGAVKSATYGSSFEDNVDDCDLNECQLSCEPATPEAAGHSDTTNAP